MVTKKEIVHFRAFFETELRWAKWHADSVLLGSGIKLNILYAPHKTSYMLANKKFLFKHKEMAVDQ